MSLLKHLPDQEALGRMPIDLIRWLMDYLTVRQSAQVANHYAETGAIPEYERLTNSCRPNAIPKFLGLGSLSYDPPLQLAPAWFDSAAACELARQKQAKNPLTRYFIQNECQLARDWLRNYTANGGTPDTHQKQAGWKGIKRQADAWHEAQIKQRTAANFTWASAADVYQDASYEVIPLLSSADREPEGLNMHHCVGSYAIQCHQGRSRIFSIRMTGTRLATAELANYGHPWPLNQNRGPCSSTPGQEIMAVAIRLQDRCNEAAQAT